tara:strand:+ start:694 stop:1302 length:609 start_codon:yes stop_codon:yes gene_type:complete
VSSKTAAYLYCPSDKEYDLDFLLDTLMLHHESESDIPELYADGWVEVPNGLSELIADLPKYDKVVLLSMEGLTTSDLRTLVDGAHLKCYFAPTDIGWVESASTSAFKRLCHTLEAKPYWDSVRSMNIKAGMKKTDKHIGNIPFGHRRTEDGKLAQIPEELAIANKVKEQYLMGIPVVSIAGTHGLTARQVYGLMEYWGVKRG